MATLNTQAQEKTIDLWGWGWGWGKTPEQTPDSDTEDLDSDTEKFLNSPTILNLLKNTDLFPQTKNFSRQQIDSSQQVLTENLETTPEQSVLKSRALWLLEIDTQSIEPGKTKSPIPSDGEDSTVSDREYDDQEALISEQPPRKKRKVNKEDVPDNARFIIICSFCPDNRKFQTFHRSGLINNFKRHLKKKHSDMPNKQTEIYIKKNLQKPELLLKLSVRCPEPECEYIAGGFQISNLNKSLSRHISAKHQGNKDNYSIKSVATHVKNHLQQTLVSAQEQSENTKKRKITDITKQQSTASISKQLPRKKRRVNKEDVPVQKQLKNTKKRKRIDITEQQSTTNVSQQHPKSSNLSTSSSSTPRQSLLQTKNIPAPSKNIDVLKQTRSLSRQQIEKQQSVLKSHALWLLEIDAQSIEPGKTKSPIPSDGEDSTVSDRKYDDQEALISEQPFSKQPPRKKRKVNKEDVPNNAYFTIICIHCSPKRPFRHHVRNNLIKMLKKHLREHQNITEQEIKIYIQQYLKKPELLLKFSINCPECEYIAHTVQRNDLNKNLSRHISTQHPGNKDNYSRKSVAKYIENNCKKELVYVKKQLPNTNFTIICSLCLHKPQFRNHVRSLLTHSFKRHLKKKHSDMPNKQTEIYIEKNLQKPELLLKLSVRCPEPECKYIAGGFQISNLNKSLSRHISAKHPGNKDNYPRKSVTKHIEDNCKKELISAQEEQLPNTNFTITCSLCISQPQFRNHVRSLLTCSFKNHLKRKHSNMTNKQTEIYIKEHLQEPELLVRFSINCPESECKHIACARSRNNLKISLSRHISTQHPKNQNNYSIKSVAKHIEKNFKRTFVPAQEKLKNTKKRKTNK